MKFQVICVVLMFDKLGCHERPLCQEFANVCLENALISEIDFTGWHLVCFNRDEVACSQSVEGCIDPSFQSESVVEEHLSVLEADNVRRGRFVVVNWNVRRC